MKPATLILIAVYVLILWALVFFVFVKGYREWKENRAERLRRFPARMMDKGSDNMLTFEYSGRQREFKVDSADYQSLRIGMTGSLILKGDQFEAFEPESDADRADQTYRRMMKD